jgi:hypothetical protein
MKTYGEADVQSHVFVTSAVVEDEWSGSRPCRFTSIEKAPRLFTYMFKIINTAKD